MQSRYPLLKKWTAEEHERLKALAEAGSRPDEIAGRSQRSGSEGARLAARHRAAPRHAEARTLKTGWVEGGHPALCSLVNGPQSSLGVLCEWAATRELVMLTREDFETDLDRQKMHQLDASQTTRQLLRRSREQIAASISLLQQQVPKIWHPQPPER
ncbi:MULTISPECIES: hypothetical protein [unclassified Bradyrhizobium]|uniref:hypothetical protein n=1 Tax=unclassified Bradyrhizobium TaxID=2631580 RepID=UPI001FFA0525|nr:MULTISPECIES: hypothetical protein [unclassified Bradyrhizobium]